MAAVALVVPLLASPVQALIIPDPVETGLLAKIAAVLQAIQEFRMRVMAEVQQQIDTRVNAYAFPNRLFDPIRTTATTVLDIRRELQRMACDWPMSFRTRSLSDLLWERTQVCRDGYQGVWGSHEAIWDGPIQEANYYNRCRCSSGGTRVQAVLTIRSSLARRWLRPLVGDRIAIPAGTVLVGEGFATQQDDRAQVVFSAIVKDGKTLQFEGWAMQEGEVGVKGKVIKKGSKGRKGAGTVLGAAASALTYGVAGAMGEGAALASLGPPPWSGPALEAVAAPSSTSRGRGPPCSQVHTKASAPHCEHVMRSGGSSHSWQASSSRSAERPARWRRMAAIAYEARGLGVVTLGVGAVEFDQDRQRPPSSLRSGAVPRRMSRSPACCKSGRSASSAVPPRSRPGAPQGAESLRARQPLRGSLRCAPAVTRAPASTPVVATDMTWAFGRRLSSPPPQVALRAGGSVGRGADVAAAPSRDRVKAVMLPRQNGRRRRRPGR